MSADGDLWFLLNASPDVRAQIESYPPLHPRDAAPLADRRHRADQRRPRSLPRPTSAFASRHPLVGLRDGRGAARSHRAQRPLPHARALRGPGDLARSRARPRGRAFDERWTGERSFARSRCRFQASSPFTSRASRRPGREENIGLRIRGRDRVAGLRVVCRGHRCRRPADARGCRLRVLRRHVLVGDGDRRPRPRVEARARTWRTCRSAATEAASRGSLTCGRRSASSSTSTTRTRSCARTRERPRPSPPRGGGSPRTGWSSSCETIP